ncbi:MAG: ABC transporter ATP-binding protein [Firmicutes bacterium]|nr:ABC transporter ATP-binding protein [Bacillota bacterium]
MPHARDTVFQLQDVSFRYPATEKPCLRDVNLEVRSGECLGIIGPTGCGKTTLLYLLSGVIPHWMRGELDGSVRILGEDTRRQNLTRLTQSIGLVMQDPEAQLFNLLVRDELVFGLENRGFERGEMDRRKDEALARFRIPHLEDRICFDLSGGEKQKVALASIYAIKPRVFLFDNPTSALDPLGTKMVFDAIEELRKTGDYTIVIVEDKIDLLFQHASRMVLMSDGRIVLDGSPRELAARPELLRRHGVMGSKVVELGAALLEAGVPIRQAITLEEATREYRELVRAGTPGKAAPHSDQGAQDNRETAGEVVLDASGLEFTYPFPRRVKAVRNVSMSMRSGEVVALIGQNGSGKTTLARCLSGFLVPQTAWTWRRSRRRGRHFTWATCSKTRTISCSGIRSATRSPSD